MIVPDGATTAWTFNGAAPDATALWITKENARGKGIYFTVNLTPAGTRKKPAKENITGIAGVWADLDPRDKNGYAWADERARLELLAAELHDLPMPPTFTSTADRPRPIACSRRTRCPE